ncbi:MAG: MFS transporter, partial [Gammaproteobacteria bacterium]
MNNKLFSRSSGVIAACTVGNAVGVTPMVYTVFSLFLIPIATEFGWPRSAVSIVLLFIAIAGALSYPVIGRLIDRFGARQIILAGNLLFAASVAAVAFTPANRWIFYSVFFVLGVTAAIPSPAMFTKVIAGWFDRSRGFALGFVGGVGNGVGAAISPVFATFLLNGFGWRGAHLGIAAAIVIIGFPILFWLLKDPPDALVTADNEAEGM